MKLNEPRKQKLERQRGDDVAQLVERRVRRAAETGSTSRCGKEFFCQSQIPVQTPPESTFSADCLMVFEQPPCSIACILTSVPTLKIPSIGSHTIVWILENTARTLGEPLKRNVAALVAGSLPKNGCTTGTYMKRGTAKKRNQGS